MTKTPLIGIEFETEFDEQAATIAAIEEAIAAADTGRVVAHDDVAAWVRSWDQLDERARPLAMSR